MTTFVTLKNILIAFGVGSSVLVSGCDREGSTPANSSGSSPSSAEEEIAEASEPVSASSNAPASLRLDEHDETPGEHQWLLTGNRIGKLTIRLLFISNGRSTVASESVLASKGNEDAKETVRINLRSEDPQPSIAVSFDNLIAQNSNVDNSATLPKGLFRLATTAIEESRAFDSQSTELLYLCGYRTEGTEEGSFGKDLDSVIAASKEGLAFVVITVLWEPAQP